jgi:uncharacterized protein (TIGR03437 family)
MGLNNVAVPKTVIFVFTGVDPGGAAWTTQIAIPFQGPQTVLAISGLGNAASGSQAFAPGELMAIYGTGFAAAAESAGAIPLPIFLGGFEATINNVPAPIYYVSPTQVNVQIPYETQPGRATMTVGNPYVNVNYAFTVAAAGPGIFTFSDGSINPSRTASAGQTVTLYVTGDGAVTPSLPTGTAPSSRTPVSNLPHPVQQVTVSVAGQNAAVSFIGIPYWAVGVTQINFTIPAGTPTGAQPVIVTVGGQPSNTAKITVQ